MALLATALCCKRGGAFGVGYSPEFVSWTIEFIGHLFADCSRQLLAPGNQRIQIRRAKFTNV